VSAASNPRPACNYSARTKKNAGSTLAIESFYPADAATATALRAPTG
jgi:hypothetical protein